MAVLDEYERKARLTPGLYAVLPVATTITTLGLDKFPVIAGLVGLLSAAGGAWLLSTAVGDLGRRTQPMLFTEWGGSPTTKMLRLRDRSENAVQRDRWRTAVERLTGLSLLSSDQEAADPGNADEHIAAATAQLLRLGQSGGEPAVRNENIAFGYQRNLWGFRHVGRAVAAVTVVVQVVAIFTPLQVSTSACVTGAAISTAFLVLWLVLPSKGRARLAAERYARQLFIAVQNQAG